MMPFYVYQLSIKVAGYTITLRHRCTNTWATHVMAENQGSKRRLWTSSPTPSPVNVQGQPVEVTDQFTYLRSAISSSGRSAPDRNTSANRTYVKHNEPTCEYLETGKVVSVHKAAAVQCLCRLCPSARYRDLDTAEIRSTEARGIQHVMPATYTRNPVVRLRHQRHHHKPDWSRKCS